MAKKIIRRELSEEGFVLQQLRNNRRPKWRGKPEDNPRLSKKARNAAKLAAMSEEMIVAIKKRLGIYKP